ncbi:tetratricopeptide repeat protein [Archangium violaceum]|uniref:CHAT domain-containing tetratricopeptide repeat protein n=1 Tax=Archangium violaceum TaxID=83451 RepID=UPI00194F69B5|nr:CHAT domain-containing protein [Archangium violaceum]QRO01309.1 tetratricopeptide repeat protein [Archangium violaceum]
MRRFLTWMTVVLLFCAAGAAAGEEQPDARLQEAQTALDEAKQLYGAGKYAEATSRAEHSLALREAVLGGTHPEVAKSLHLLGAIYLARGEFARAEPLFQRSLEIREAALGKSHPDVAASLNALGKLYSDRGLYARAEPLLQRALEIREAALGEKHDDVAMTLNNLANLYRAQGLYARAEPLYQRTLAIHEAVLGANHPLVAQSINNLAILYYGQGLYSQAEPLFQRSLASLEAALGKDHPDVAYVLNNLASVYHARGSYERAASLYERAIAIREAALGKDHPLVATAVGNLANVYRDQGLYEQAERLYTRVIAINEVAFGKDNPRVATTLGNLANVYIDQGQYERAEALFQRALSIWEVARGKEHPEIAPLVTGLAIIYRRQGFYERAAPFYERARSIWEAVLGKDHPHVATALGNLAQLYNDQGQYARARPLYERALEIREAALGKNHPEVADALDSLANLYKEQGQYERARPLFERALAIHEAAFGKKHPASARVLNNLATFYDHSGAQERAEPLVRRALALWEETLGANHPNVATALGLLAHIRLARHRLSEALPLLTRSFVISEGRLRREALDFSEVRLANFLQFLRAEEEGLYALLRAHPEDARVRRLALGAVLLLKGRSVEETADTSRTIYRSLSAEDRDTFERLRGLRTQLAKLSLQGPVSRAPADYQRRLKELIEQGDALEADLARRSAPLRARRALPAPDKVVDRVAAALPKDGALVELISYVDHPLVHAPGTSEPKTPGEPRYLAVVLFPDGRTRVLDLGLAAPIDAAASQLRHALAIRDAAFQTHAQALHDQVFRPLLPLLGKTRRLFLSPDGQLGLVPFAALHDGQRFLVDAFDITYLTSGRDLLPRPQETAPSHSVVVLADPDFSAAPSAPTSSEAPASELAERSASLERFFSTRRASLAEGSWTPLPGTRQEAEAIQRLIPQAQLFLGLEATKERLLHLATPGVLHVATHGFFLDDAPVPEGSRAVGHFGALGDRARALAPDPLLRSGLVLSGVRAPAPDGSAKTPSEGALVTALELAGLNLWGTELVVLSACDTGRGDVKPGQGVYGLRRAFVVAGAETVVMSLWKVKDDTTRQLMEGYYRNLLAGQGRATALREAMRALRQTQPHPHDWAPFIALGRDAPLRSLASGPQAALEK